MMLELIGQDIPQNNWADPNQARNIDVLKAPCEIFAASSSSNIVSKIHSYERDFLLWLRQHGAKCIVTKRDTHEILASHYHHFSKEKIWLPCRLYAATIGLVKAIEVILYERIATSDDVCDIVLDFSHVKASPVNALFEIVSALGLNYSLEEIIAAAEQANMRERDYGDTFAGMNDRAWFFRRDESSLNDTDLNVLASCVNLAHKISNVPLLSQVATWIFMRDPRRSKFRRQYHRSETKSAGKTEGPQ